MSSRQYAITVLLAIALITGQNSSCSAAESAAEIEKGVVAAQSGQLDLAIDIWTKAIKKNPRSYAAHVNRGTAYMKTGHVSKAVIDWHRARALSPLFAYSVYCEDFIFEAPGNPAMLSYAAALELEPDYIVSVTMFGSMLLDLGQKARAVELFRRSVDLTMNDMLKARLEYWADSIGRK